jgi:hypothetical protein
MSEQATCRKTYKEKLRPTPTQERQRGAVLWQCRTLYYTALAQRIFLWKQRGVSIPRYQQEAELKVLRAECQEDDTVERARLRAWPRTVLRSVRPLPSRTAE